MANDGITAKYCSTRVDDNIVFNSWMALTLSIFFIHAQSTKCNALVDLDMVSKHTGLTNHDTRSMIDAEVVSDFCCRMYVNPGSSMSMLGDDPGNSVHSQNM